MASYFISIQRIAQYITQTNHVNRVDKVHWVENATHRNGDLIFAIGTTLRQLKISEIAEVGSGIENFTALCVHYINMCTVSHKRVLADKISTEFPNVFIARKVNGLLRNPL